MAQFLKMRGETYGLGMLSEQAMESCHHDFKIEWQNRKVGLSHSELGERLLDTIVRYNSKHLWLHQQKEYNYHMYSSLMWLVFIYNVIINWKLCDILSTISSCDDLIVYCDQSYFDKLILNGKLCDCISTISSCNDLIV